MRMFESLLGKNVEIYIDDMVVKKKSGKWEVGSGKYALISQT